MKKRLLQFAPLSALLILPILGVIYDVLNARNVKMHIVLTEVDNLITFNKLFIVPYLLWFPFVFVCLVYFLKKDKKLYYITLGSDVIGRLICFVIYYFLPTTVPRPHVVGTDIFSQLVVWLYGMDNPTNCFPSIHCLSTALIMIAINSSSFKNKVNVSIINILGGSIILSTLFIKQHAVLDVVSSIVLSLMLFTILSYVAQRKPFFFTKRSFVKSDATFTNE